MQQMPNKYQLSRLIIIKVYLGNSIPRSFTTMKLDEWDQGQAV